MGDRDRDRYQSYYDSNDRNDHTEGRYGNRDESQYPRGSRDWNRDDYGQSQDRQRSQNFRDYDERGYTGASYAQDRDYGRRGYAGSQYPQERDFNAGYTGYGAEPRRFPGTFGSNEDRRSGREPEQARFGRDYGAPNWNRNERSHDYDRPRFGREYGERPYGGSDWNRNLSQERYGQPNWGNEPYRGEQRGRDESWTHQLREAGQQVVRRVKRAFRGPKGYKRSDERIREDVNDRLAQQDHLDPSEIEVTVSNAEVTLIGLVESRHEKFLAEEIADDVSGVTDVHNQLRVRRTQGATTGQATETSTTLGAQAATEASRNRNARAQ